MISALIDADDDPLALSRTLASLVPGAVEGLVRDVVVVAKAGQEGVARVAEHAGCRIVEPCDLDGALRGAKGDWLLFLASGAQLPTGWIEAVSEFVGAAGARGSTGARFRVAATDRPALPKRLFVRPSALERGVLVRRADLPVVRAGTARSLADMAAGVRTREIAAEIRLPRRR